MRDYSGWKVEGQQRFKNMLVYPGYSNTEDFSSKYANYWVIQRTELHSIGIFLISMPQGLVTRTFRCSWNDGNGDLLR